MKCLVKSANVANIRFYDIRHTHTSILISEGVDIVKISRRLGHANPKITLEFYAHLLRNAVTFQTFFTKPSKVTLNNWEKSCGQILK